MKKIVVVLALLAPTFAWARGHAVASDKGLLDQQVADQRAGAPLLK
jgi:hypothetical protein